MTRVFADHPNLTAAQRAALQTIGPLPEFVYRANPDISVFPTNTRSGGSDGTIKDSPDKHLIPPEEMKKRRVMYFGTAELASSYAKIIPVHVPGDMADAAPVPADSLSIQEYYRRAGSELSLENFAEGQSRFYRIALADILARMGPETVIVRDVMANAWAVVGQLTSDVPAAHIQIIRRGEPGTLLRDGLTGQTAWVQNLEDAVLFEPAARGLTPEPVPRLDLYLRRENEFKALRRYFATHGIPGDSDALYRKLHNHTGVEMGYNIAGFVREPFDSLKPYAIASEASPGSLENYLRQKYALNIETDRADPLKNLQLHVVMQDESRAFLKILETRECASQKEVRAALQQYFRDHIAPIDHPIFCGSGDAAISPARDPGSLPPRPNLSADQPTLVSRLG